MSCDVARRRVAVCVLCLSFIAACGAQTTGIKRTTTSPSPSVPTSNTEGVPLVNGTMSITGQFVVVGTFISRPTVDVNGVATSAPATTTCGSYAQGFAQTPQAGGGTGFDAPPAKADGPTDAYISVSLQSGYRGPGTYSSGTTPLLSGTATIAVSSAQGSSYYVFHSHGSGTTLQVAPDGSGSVHFAGWLDDETRGGNQTGVITGVIKWTCH